MQTRLTFDTKGFEREFDRIRRDLPSASKQGLKWAGIDLILITRPRVPWRKGDLSNSGKVKIINPYYAIVVYSSQSPQGYDYAEIQHRRCDFKHPVQGICKYLSTSAKEYEPKFPTRMMDTMVNYF